MSVKEAIKLAQEQFPEEGGERINRFTFTLKQAQLLTKKQKRDLIEILKKDL